MKTKTASQALKSGELNYIFIATAAILAIPLIMSQVSDSWQWGVIDYLLIGGLVLSAGLVYELIAKRLVPMQYHLLAAVVVVLGVLAIWAQLAVDWLSQVLLMLGV